MVVQNENIIIDESNGRYDEISVFAATNPQGQSFKNCIDRLKQICANYPDSKCVLGADYAPNSLSFGIFDGEFPDCKLILGGGIIHHGCHDGYGSGSAPTFSVTLDTSVGWRIHT